MATDEFDLSEVEVEPTQPDQIRFTTEFIATVQKYTDAPISFIRDGAIWLISTIAGRQIKIFGPKDLFLNLWFLLVGESRLSRKTTVLFWVRKVLEANFPPKVPLWAPKGSKAICPRLLPDEFSPEAFVKALSEQPISGYLRDECTSMMKAFQRQYMSGMAEALSRAYDCQTVSRYTKTGGLEVAHDVYLTILTASTPSIARYFTGDLFEQGFGNRFIYDVDCDDRDYKKYPFDQTPQGRERNIGALANLLRQLDEFVKVEKYLIPHPEAERLFHQWEERITELQKKKRAKDRTDLDIRYLGQMTDLTLQIAGIFTLDRLFLDKSQINDPSLIIDLDSMREAIDYVQNHVLRGYKEFKTLRRTIRPEKQAEAYTDDKELVYDTIKELEPVPQSSLYNPTRLKKDDLEPILVELISEERIVIQHLKTKGRPATLYRTKET